MKLRNLLTLVGAALIVAICVTSSASGASRSRLYVDQNSVGGTCSDSYTAVQAKNASTPWCSLVQAAADAPAGSTVLVRAGDYPYQEISGTYPSRARLTSYVTFEPYGYGTTSQESVTIEGMRLTGISFLRFQGFNLVGTDASDSPLTPAVFVASQAGGSQVSHVQIVGNDITGDGIDITGDPSDALIEDNHIHNLTTNCADATQVDGSGIIGGGNDVQIVGNTIDQAPDAAMSFGDASNFTVSDNVVSSINQTAAQCGRHVDIVELDNHADGPVTLSGNTFTGGQLILRNATGFTIENNLFLDIGGWAQLVADPGAKIINNTWWGGNTICTGCGSLLIRDYAPGSSFTKPPFNYTNQMNGTDIENNIMHVLGNDAVPASQYTEDNNLIYTPPVSNSGIENPGSHDIYASPLFVGPSRGDYHLASGSPGVAAGDPSVAPMTDMDGNGWSGTPDIGALQQPGNRGGKVPKPTLGHVSLVGVARRSATVRFTVAAGKGFSILKAIKVHLPKSLSFRGRSTRITRSITVKLDGRKLRFHASRKGADVLIALARRTSVAQVTIRSKAIWVSKKLAKSVTHLKHRHVHKLRGVVMVFEVGHPATKLKLTMGVRR